MGWAGGSSLLSEVWRAVEKHLAPNSRLLVCKRLIDAFESEDCDTIDECFDTDPVFEVAYYELHPEHDARPHPGTVAPPSQWEQLGNDKEIAQAILDMVAQLKRGRHGT